jgi:hypothetical protein
MAAIRDQCLELLLTLAILCSSLSYILSTLKLLLFLPPSGQAGLQVRAVLAKFRALSRTVHMDQPSSTNFDTRLVLADLAEASTFSCCTDGDYLYVHSSVGLMKIGTGAGASTPGQLYVHISGFRSGERSSLACVGGLLFYRSASLTPAAMLVLSTAHLLEVGQVMRDGSGSFASADLAAVPFWQPAKEAKKGDAKKDAKDKEREARRQVATSASSTSSNVIAPPGASMEEEKSSAPAPGPSASSSSSSSSSSSGIPSGSDDMAMLAKMKGQSSLGTSRADELQRKVEEEEARQRKALEEDRIKREAEERKAMDPAAALAEETAAAAKPGKPGKDGAAKDGKSGSSSSSSSSSSVAGPAVPGATEEKKDELDANGMPRITPASRAAATAAPKSSEKPVAPTTSTSSKKAAAYFATLLADSQFLHVVSAAPAPAGERVEVSVHSLDAVGDAMQQPRLDLAHQVTLRACAPSGKMVIRLDASDVGGKGKQPKKPVMKTARGNIQPCIRLGWSATKHAYATRIACRIV